ncbi:MAG: hypothetical protein K2K34_01365 [Oscillospiraceae bacterium]|nr:hypothetical protein [Oscillospiraceae bacterium]
MKKYLSAVIAVILISAVFLAGCNSGSPDSGLSDAGGVQLVDEKEADASEEASGTERDDVQNAENSGGYDEYKGENDFYIIVTDRNGEEKALYYRQNEEEGQPNIYMEEVRDNPDVMFKYRSIASSSEPAKNGEVFFGEKLRDFAEQADFKELCFYYNVSEGSRTERNLVKSKNEKRYSKMSELILSFEPKYVPELKGVEITKYGNYDQRYPIRYISFDYDDQLFNDFPKLHMDFCKYNGDIIGRLVISDYSEIQKLARGPQPVEKSALEEAYYKSEYCVSDWFYAGDTELYDYALRCIILSEKNEFYNVRQERALTAYSSRGGFSDNIAERINTDTDNLIGYQDVQFGGFYIKLPGDKKPAMTEKTLFMSAGSDSEMLVKISKTSILLEGSDTSELWYAYYNGKTSGTYGNYTLYDYAEGTFNGEKCQYISYRNDITERIYYSITVKSADGEYYNVTCSLNGDELTDEFNELAKNVFGSISLFAPDEKIPEAKIRLSDTPSIYSDDCYEIAEGMPFYGTTTEYKAFCPGVVEASFYAVDFRNNYDTGFECYLEKQETDGLWYTVEPIGNVVQANGGASGHFYNVFEEGRKNISFDLAAYPLLPAGKYRLAKPFWDEGGSDRDQYAAFYEFTMDEKTKTGDEIAGTASCEKEDYTADVREIKYSVDIEGGAYSVSDITDIERLENGEWTSVRNCSVKTNSIGGSYALRFSGMEETIDTSGFDISEAGEYRIRISVGEVDMDRENMFVNNYDTKYAYFKIV